MTYLFKFELPVVWTRESSPNVQQIHIETQLILCTKLRFCFSLLCKIPNKSNACILATTHPHIKYTSGISDGLCVSLRISAATADMETDTDHVQPQFFCPLKKTSARLKRGPELHAQTTHCLWVVCSNTQHQPKDKTQIWLSKCSQGCT